MMHLKQCRTILTRRHQVQRPGRALLSSSASSAARSFLTSTAVGADARMRSQSSTNTCAARVTSQPGVPESCQTAPTAPLCLANLRPLNHHSEQPSTDHAGCVTRTCMPCKACFYRQFEYLTWQGHRCKQGCVQYGANSIEICTVITYITVQRMLLRIVWRDSTGNSMYNLVPETWYCAGRSLCLCWGAKDL